MNIERIHVNEEMCIMYCYLFYITSVALKTCRNIQQCVKTRKEITDRVF